MKIHNVLQRVLLPVLAVAILLVGCASAGDSRPAIEPDAETGELAAGIKYGFRTIRHSEGFSYGMAAKWEIRPVGKVSINFSASGDNCYPIAMTLTDSAERLLGQTGLLLPGSHLTELQLSGIPADSSEITVTVCAYGERGEVVHSSTQYVMLTKLEQ